VRSITFSPVIAPCSAMFSPGPGRVVLSGVLRGLALLPQGKGQGYGLPFAE
jgi:hypothetical protein